MQNKNIREILCTLIELQNIDSKRQEHIEEKGRMESEIREIENMIMAKKKHVEDGKNQITQFKIQLKNLEIECSNIEEQIKKHQKELSAVKKNEEYRALLDEINRCKEEKSKIEDKMLEIMEKIESCESGYREEIKKISEEEKIYNEKVNDIKKLIQKEEEKISEITAVRDEISRKLREKDEDLFSLYEAILKTRGGLAVAEVIEDRYCGGCNISLPVEVVERIRKNENIYTCDNCSRILYIKSAMGENCDKRNEVEITKSDNSEQN
jgi:predicted  nucleic acid-binding Zn-ribbon protein